MRAFAGHVWLFASCIIATATGACVPDFPERLLADAAVLQHPSIVAAFEEVEREVSSLYINTTRDGLSFAIVSTLHAHQPTLLTISSRSTLQRRVAYTPSATAHSR
jgi:hypothetical protein